MAIASTPTLMSLGQYCAILGVNPVHFNQAFATRFPESGGCGALWYQKDYYHPGRASREELGRCLAQAEAMVADLVGFWPAPKWEIAENARYPRQRQMSSNSLGTMFYPAMSIGRRKTIPTNWRYFIEGGRRRVETIQLARPVIYSDPDGDGFNERATITATYTGSGTLVAEEVAVFFGTDTSDAERIRYLEITLGAGGAITIVGHSAQFFVPALWDGAADIDADNIANYVDEVNVYRIYNCADDNAYAPAEFLWQTQSSVGFTQGYGVLQEWDGDRGIVTPIPATWDSTTSTWSAQTFRCMLEPHRLRMYYRAGWPRDSRNRVAAPFAQAVAALATALMSRPVCGCGQANKQVGRWQQYPSADVPIGFRHLECPWGDRLGAWEAYALLTRHFGDGGGLSL